jgi:hypothetical protein
VDVMSKREVSTVFMMELTRGSEKNWYAYFPYNRTCTFPTVFLIDILGPSK